MFWVGLVVGIVLTLILLFELGHYLEKRKGREKDDSKATTTKPST